MIILDTNVISEPLRSAPDTKVVAWLDTQPTATLAITSVTLAEVRFGIACLPQGRRRDRLHDRFEDQVVPAFEDRVLDFDGLAATAYATIRSTARAQSRTISMADAMIAAVAATHHASVATRDTAPFAAAGLEVIDPFA